MGQISFAIIHLPYCTLGVCLIEFTYGYAATDIFGWSVIVHLKDDSMYANTSLKGRPFSILKQLKILHTLIHAFVSAIRSCKCCTASPV